MKNIKINITRVNKIDYSKFKDKNLYKFPNLFNKLDRPILT